MKSAGNFFDPIRHFAAFLVLFSHHFALSGRPEPMIPKWDTFGFVAVAIFFAISGYFMPQSHASSGGFLPFMVKRCRRIFPGLIVCVFIMIYVIGAAFTPSGLISYLFDMEQVRTFVSYLVFLERRIDGVFSDFIFKYAINGSLWTLPVEFAWYVIIGSALSLYRSWKTAAALLWASSIAIWIMTVTGFNYAFYTVPLNYLALFGVAFSMGAMLSMTQETWLPYRPHLAIFSVIILTTFRGRPECQVLGTASLAILTIIAGVSFTDTFLRRKIDISYGVYIYAFPIQQIVINRITDSFWIGMVLSAVLTTIVGTLSYIFVERRFLRKGPYVLSSTLRSAVA